MIPAGPLRMNKSCLAIPVLAAGLWLLSQFGWFPESDPGPDTAAAVAAVPHVSDHDLRRRGAGLRPDLEPVGLAEVLHTPHQSLKRASTLLRRAADVLDENESLAVHLIRQVIALLKYHVIPSLNMPEATLVPIAAPDAGTAQGALSGAMVAPGLPNSPCTHQGSEEVSDSPIQRYEQDA